VQVAVGVDYTCALLTGGAVKCWGDNDLGQLGAGNLLSTLAPPVNAVHLGRPATQIALGGDQPHTCALLTGGTVKCWGADPYGELGLPGHVSRLPPANTPVRLRGRATQIAAGYWFTCAVLEGGTVKCWGMDYSGELGDGDAGTNRHVPENKPIKLGARAIQVAGGVHFACALLLGGAVKCWGDNEFGELGRSVPSLSRPSKYPINLGRDATQITVGDEHACALLAGGDVKCWGYNSAEQLGGSDPSLPSTAAPQRVQLGGRATQISAGGEHTCALLTGGGIKCWGRNDVGQLGQGNNELYPLPPARSVALPMPALQVDAGGFTTCAILTNRSVICWGSSAGYGDDVSRDSPPVNPIDLSGPEGSNGV
jgi:alpha-tubulin suppressor-like RCC1 family protein